MTRTPDISTGDHIGDLLPALINGTLDAEAAMRVRGHLDRCAACRGGRGFTPRW